MNFPISLYTIEIRIVSVGFEVAFHPRTSNPFRSIAFAKLIFPRAHISFLLMFSAFQPYPNVKPTEGFMLALLLFFFAICCCLRVCVFLRCISDFYFYETGINTLISISIRSTNLILASILRVLCHLFWFYIYFYSFGNKSKKMHIWHLTIFLHRFLFAVAVITEQPVHDVALSIRAWKFSATFNLIRTSFFFYFG